MHIMGKTETSTLGSPLPRKLHKDRLVLPNMLSLPDRRQAEESTKVSPQEVIQESQPTIAEKAVPPASPYPPELLAIMDAETKKLEAFIAKSPPPSPRQKRKDRRKGRVSELRQVTAVECGAACLAMILNYYGYACRIAEVQERCGVGRDGLSAYALVKSAKVYGLRVRAISLKENDFRYVSLPAIIHWQFNHFLIVERWSHKWVDVVDPAVGRRRLSAEEFDEGFTGVVLMLEPGNQFQRRAPQKALSLWSYLSSFLSMRTVLAQILGASLFLQVLGLGGPLFTAIILDTVLPSKNLSMLTIICLGMVLLAITQGATSALRSFLLIYLQTRTDISMMLNFFEHLLSLPYRFFQLRLNGDLLARVSSNQKIRDLLTNQLISAILDGCTVIISFVILLSFSRFIAFVTLAIGIVQVGLLLITTPALRKLTQQDLDAQGKTQGYLTEALAGIATLKAAGAEQRAFTRWENFFFDEINISLRLQVFTSLVSVILDRK